MFQYFPDNYVWSLSVAIALESGGKVGEVDAICRPLLEAAKAGDDPGTPAFFAAWCAMAASLEALADTDDRHARTLSAGAKRLRACLYYLIAERMQRHADPARAAVYATALHAFRRGIEQTGAPARRVEIPYGPAHIAGLFVPALGASGPAPCVVQVNGLDSTKELLYFNGLAQSLARRGVASLIVDQPGTGEALRLHGLTALVESERWASPVLDWLQAHPTVGGTGVIDPARIALLGVSLGGYYAPRAVAFDPRWAAGAVWGANHDWGAMQRRRRDREGERPVPHYWDHVKWVWGADTIERFMETAAHVHLDGVLDRIRVPFLVTHGKNDRQIPLADAHRTFDALVNSTRRDLVVFDEQTGGVEHSSLDNMANAGDAIADWLTEVLTTPFYR